MDSFSGRSARVPARESQSTHTAEVSRPVETVPMREHTGHVGRRAESRKKPAKWMVVVGGLVLLAIVGCMVWQALRAYTVPGVRGDEYQAVFLTNGQVYFGKLGVQSPGYYKLTNIYYLQATQAATETDANNPQKTSSTNSDVQLIKLGNEIHGPEDAMVIAKDQVLFFENLKNDGNVAATIKDYVNKNNK